MTIRDNGVGIPDGVHIDNTDSMGFKVIRNLVRDQLRGTLTVERDRGTGVIIECPS